jgi:hypothetical protein
MAGRQDEAVPQDLLAARQHDPADGAVSKHEVGDTGAETHLPARLEDGLAHTGDDAGQLVRADVGMRVDEDVGARSVGHERLKHARDVASLSASRVELAVAVGAGAPFAEAVVAVGVDDVSLRDGREIVATRADVFAAFEHDGAKAERDGA